MTLIYTIRSRSHLPPSSKKKINSPLTSDLCLFYFLGGKIADLWSRMSTTSLMFKNNGKRVQPTNPNCTLSTIESLSQPFPFRRLDNKPKPSKIPISPIRLNPIFPYLILGCILHLAPQTKKEKKQKNTPSEERFWRRESARERMTSASLCQSTLQSQVNGFPGGLKLRKLQPSSSPNSVTFTRWGFDAYFFLGYDLFALTIGGLLLFWWLL